MYYFVKRVLFKIIATKIKLALVFVVLSLAGVLLGRILRAKVSIPGDHGSISQQVR